MRVSTLEMQRQAVQGILDQQAAMSRTQLQISSGRRVLSPADDPSAAEQVLSLQQALTINNQYARNSTVARNRLQLEESTLGNVTDLLHGVRERAIQGVNDTLTASDRRFVATELRERLNQLLELANTRDSNGEYIFAGNRSLTQPFARQADGSYAYNGDDSRREVLIGAEYRVPISDAGSDVFQRIRAGNGDFVAADGAGNSGTGVIDPGSVIDPGRYDREDYTLLMTLETEATGGIAVSDPGAPPAGYALSINGVDVYQEADVSAAPLGVTSLEELADAVNDDTVDTGVAALVVDGRLHLHREPSTGEPVEIVESLTGASPGTEVTGVFGSTLTDEHASDGVRLEPEATHWVARRDTTDAAVASGRYGEREQIAFQGIETDIHGEPHAGDTFSLRTAGHQDLFTTLETLIATLEDPGATDADRAAFHNDMNETISALDRGVDNILAVRAQVGGRLQAIDAEEQVNQDVTLFTETTLSEVQDLDYASAISEFQLQLVAVQAAQQAFVRMQGLSLFNFL
jgi:flagellar hook-associated protein 3 FlgL